MYQHLLPEDLTESIRRDQQERARCRCPAPQMINTMDESDLWNDPIRHYMIPALRDRDSEWPTTPCQGRDSLHETDMWAVEGLTHRYPTKVLAELLSTCPQYCGHCTRMDLIGNNVPQFVKHRFELKQKERYEAVAGYLRETPTVRDVVVSGGDIANLPISHVESFVGALMDIPNIHDIRLATKGLMGLPQHFLQDDVLAGMDRLAAKAIERDVELHDPHPCEPRQLADPTRCQSGKEAAIHGIQRHPQSRRAAAGGQSNTPEALLDLCFGLLDDVKVMPYYFYMCDLIPLNSESTGRVRRPGAETPTRHHGLPARVCNSAHRLRRPLRWKEMGPPGDRVRPGAGVSSWTKNYRTSIETEQPDRGRPASTSTSTRSHRFRKRVRTTGRRVLGSRCYRLSPDGEAGNSPLARACRGLAPGQGRPRSLVADSATTSLPSMWTCSTSIQRRGIGSAPNLMAMPGSWLPRSLASLPSAGRCRTPRPDRGGMLVRGASRRWGRAGQSRRWASGSRRWYR